VRSKEPLYQKIKQDLLSEFNKLSYYDLIPSERELSLALGVSRPTLRKALEELEQEKIITRIHGRGTFYLGNKVTINYSDPKEKHNVGLFNVLSAEGNYTRSQVLQQTLEFPDAETSAFLNLNDEEIVFHLKRLRYVNEELYSLTDDFIPLKSCPNLVNVDFTEHSLMNELREAGVVAYKEDKTIEVRKADASEAAYLKLQKGDPISVTRIMTYDQSGTAIQYALSKANAYKSRFRVTTFLNNE